MNHCETEANIREILIVHLSHKLNFPETFQKIVNTIALIVVHYLQRYTLLMKDFVSSTNRSYASPIILHGSHWKFAGVKGYCLRHYPQIFFLVKGLVPLYIIAQKKSAKYNDILYH